MKLWRFLPNRSARSMASRELRRARNEPAWRSRWQRAQSWMRSGDWRPPVISALALSVPLAWCLGREPGDWLQGAWQVSAVLVGLAVALIIFLMQAAGTQSLRATVTYRAIVASTFLAWPVAFAIVFLGWVAAIERFSSGEHATAWANTYSLGLFIAQLALFGAVFLKVLRIVAPQGVVAVLEGAFKDSVRRSVEEKLRRKVATAELEKRAAEAGMSSRWATSGRRVRPSETGWVADIDMRLPKTLVDHGFAHEVSLTAHLGDSANPSTEIARIDGQVTPWRERPLQRGVHIRRRHGDAPSPLDVFDEALDFARRAIDERTRGAMKQAFDVLVACVSELPRSYRLYGVDYTAETTSEGVFLFPSTEDRLVRELGRFSREVIVSGSDDAVRELPILPYRLALQGVEQSAPYLVDQALQLWAVQVNAARSTARPDTRELLFENVSELLRSLVEQLSWRLEDEHLDLNERFATVPFLAQLFRFEYELLKGHAEAGDVEAFQAIWRRSVEWGRHWTPEHDVDDLELRLSLTDDAESQKRLGRALDDAREVLNVRDELVAVRHWAQLQLGAWLMQEFRDGNLDEDLWTRLVPYLIGPFESSEALAGALPEVWNASDEQLGQLHQWEAAKLTPGAGFARLDYRDVATFWGTLLLLRRAHPGKEVELDLGHSAQWLGEQLLKHVDAIDQAPAKWASVVEGDVPAKVGALRDAVQNAISADVEARARHVATAPLSDGRIEEFAVAQRQGFAKANILREVLMRVGAVEVEVTHEAFSTAAHGDLANRRIFIEDESETLVMGSGRSGELAAIAEQEQIAEGMAAYAREHPAGDDPVEAAVQAIAALRAAGLRPDAVVVPRTGLIRLRLSRHEKFRWAHRGPIEGARELGYLDDVPVYDVAKRDADYLLVADLEAAVRVRERRREDMPAPLRVEVRSIDAGRAEARLAEEKVNWDETKVSKEEAVRRLVEERVEVLVDLDYGVVPGPKGAEAVARVPIEPEHQDPSEH